MKPSSKFGLKSNYAFFSFFLLSFSFIQIPPYTQYQILFSTHFTSKLAIKLNLIHLFFQVQADLTSKDTSKWIVGANSTLKP